MSKLAWIVGALFAVQLAIVGGFVYEARHPVDRWLLQGDGSVVNARAYVDGVYIGRLTAAAGKLPDLPTNCVADAHGLVVFRPSDDATFLKPSSGYAVCRTRSKATCARRLERLSVVSASGETLSVDVLPGKTYSVRVSFALRAVQVLEQSD